MTRPRIPRPLVAVLLAVLVVGLSGCSGLPEDGSVRSVAVGDQVEGEALVDYTPPGPEKGQAPASLVQSWLTAMIATPLNTSVARKFLTSGRSNGWVPEKGTVVYGDSRLVTRPGGRVLLQLRDVVELDSRGAWRGDPTGGRGRDWTLRLVKEDGEWRISHPPDRLLVPTTHFETQYQQYYLYFFDTSAQVLVPEPVYVPRGLQAPTVLLAGLLQGPEEGMERVETSYLPRGTVLDGISVPVSREGTAEVPLSDEVLDASDEQLGRVFAQLSWTLGQIPGVQRIRVTVDGTPVDLAGNSRVDVGVGQFSEYDPAVAWASSTVFGIRDKRVVAVSGGEENRVGGAFGALPAGLRSLAVDLAAQRVAGVSTDGRSVLESDKDRGATDPPTPTDVRTLYAGGTDVLRPAYDLYGQLWLVDRTRSGARVSVVRGDKATAIDVPGVTGRSVSRFIMSRDGTRLVAQLRAGGRDRLVVARVERDEKGRPRAFRAAEPLPVAGTGGLDIRDFGWRTPGKLAVLTGSSSGTSQVLLVKIDGSSAPEELSADAEPIREDAVRVVTSPAAGAPLFLATVRGQVFSLASNGRWTGTGIEPGLGAATFVG